MELEVTNFKEDTSGEKFSWRAFFMKTFNSDKYAKEQLRKSVRSIAMEYGFHTMRGEKENRLFYCTKPNNYIFALDFDDEQQVIYILFEPGYECEECSVVGSYKYFSKKSIDHEINTHIKIYRLKYPNGGGYNKVK